MRGPATGRGARPVEVDADAREVVRVRARLHRARRHGRHVVRVLRPAVQSRGRHRRARRRHQDLLRARLQPGGQLPHRGAPRWRGLRPQGHGEAPQRRAHADDPRRPRGGPRARPSRPDGSYRAAAGRLLEGKILGGFRYLGTRPDDPNDIVPHEHRRELRALRVFGAWTNLTDMKAGNTLDTLIEEGGRHVVRHYLQDVGSTFGMGANGPHDWDEGFEYVYDGPRHASPSPDVRLRAEPVADGQVRAVLQVDRPLRGRQFRSPHVEAPRADVGVPAHARRRRVLGRAAGDGVLRRDDSRHRQDGAVQRARRRTLPRRRPDQAPRQDRQGVPDAAGPCRLARRSTPRASSPSSNIASRHALASEPRAWKATWFTFDNATGESRPMGDVSGAAPRLAAPARPAVGAGRVRPRRRVGRSPRVPAVGDARADLLPS